MFALQNVFDRKENDRKLKIENKPKQLPFVFKQ